MKAFRVLRGVIHREWYVREVERPLLDWFKDVIFRPLLEMLDEDGIKPDPADQGPPSKLNARASAVQAALEDGRIWYAQGKFIGRFTPAVSRELRELGAKFSSTEHAFSIEEAKLPHDLVLAAAQSELRAKSLYQRLTGLLTAMQENIAIAPIGLSFTKAIDNIADDLQNQFEKTIDGVESIEVSVELTPEMRKALTADFTQSLDLPIKNFAAEQLPELRQLVEQNAFSGYRTDRLAQIIGARYGIAKRKAAFLANQETSLLVSKYREQSAKSVGSSHYRWNTSHDDLVRPAHRVLNGKIFAWDEPPLIAGTSRHCNPGEDFNCRCIALPIIEVLETASILL